MAIRSKTRRWKTIAGIFTWGTLAACVLVTCTNSAGHTVEKTLALAVAAVVGFWALYANVQSLKTGRVLFRGSTYERIRSPWWYWFYTAGAGIVGLIVLASFVYLATGLL